MSIPIMIAAGIFSVPDLLEVPNLGGFLPILAVGFVAAAIVGYLSIHWLLSFLTKRSLVYFAAYCVLLASAVLIISNIRPASADLATEIPVAPPQVNQANASITQIAQVSTSAATGWILHTASECAAGIPELALATDTANQTTQEKMVTSVDFQWGEPATSPGYAVVLGESQLVFIVNPENPLVKLPLTQLEKIHNGTLTTWSDLLSSCPNCYNEPPAADVLDSPIQLYSYPADSDALDAFESHFTASPRVLNSAIIVPSTAAMNEAVLADPSAFGFLPSQAMDEEVLLVNLTKSGESFEVTLPLLAITTSEPQNPAREWLACVQEELAP